MRRRAPRRHTCLLLAQEPTNTMTVLSKLEYSLLQRTLLTLDKNRTALNIAGIRWKHGDKNSNPPNFPIKNDIHVTSAQEYPAARTLDLPSNVEDIASSEKSRFSPQRNRDISGSFISSISSANVEAKTEKSCAPSDARVASYDCSGAVSLSSAMQTNVPDPFRSKGKSTHLNMPGGQWGQGEKYMSDELNNSHHVNTRGNRSVGIGSSISGVKKNKLTSMVLASGTGFTYGTYGLLSRHSETQPVNMYCTGKAEGNENKPDITDKPSQLTRKDKLKAAIKDYGIVVTVFHVGISLMSLGCCYLAITSGIDLQSIISRWGASEGAAVAGTAAPFVVAYAIHKTMAPARIAVTLATVPFLVKYLRRIGLIKPPKTKSNI